MRALLLILPLLISAQSQIQLQPIFSSSKDVKEWITHQGEVLGWIAGDGLHLRGQKNTVVKGEKLKVESLSNTANYLVISKYTQISKGGRKLLKGYFTRVQTLTGDTLNFVLTTHYDEKRYQVVVNEQGNMLLLEPGYGRIRFYVNEEWIPDRQLRKELPFSLERRGLAIYFQGSWWVGYETVAGRPARLEQYDNNGSLIDSWEMPFQSWQQLVPGKLYLLVAGYTYHPGKSYFEPVAQLLDTKGRVVATQAVFTHAAAFSPDGRWLALRIGGKEIARWDLIRNTLEQHTLRDKSKRFLQVAITSEGTLGAVKIPYDYFAKRRNQPPEFVIYQSQGTLVRLRLEDVAAPWNPPVEADESHLYVGMPTRYCRIVER